MVPLRVIRNSLEQTAAPRMPPPESPVFYKAFGCDVPKNAHVLLVCARGTYAKAIGFTKLLAATCPNAHVLLDARGEHMQMPCVLQSFWLLCAKMPTFYWYARGMRSNMRAKRSD